MSSKVRRQCSLYGLNLQLDNGGGSSQPCPPLDCLKRRQSDHTCHHPHRFNELATKSEKWNGKPRLKCVDGRHKPSKTPVDVVPWTCRSEGKRPIKQTGGQSNPHKWLASPEIWRVEKLETLPTGTKPRTSYHWSPGGERRSKGKHKTIFLERTGECHRQADERWNRFKGNVGCLRDGVERIWAFPSA